MSQTITAANLEQARAGYVGAAEHAAYTATRMARLLLDRPEAAPEAEADADSAALVAAAMHRLYTYAKEQHAAAAAAAAPKRTTMGDLMMEDMAANDAAWNSPAAVAARAAEIDAARALLAASKVKRPRK
jgi:hypothetical protein